MKKKIKDSLKDPIVKIIEIKIGPNYFYSDFKDFSIKDSIITLKAPFQMIKKVDSTHRHFDKGLTVPDSIKDFSIQFKEPIEGVLIFKSWDSYREINLLKSKLTWEWLKISFEDSLKLYNVWRDSIKEEVRRQVKQINRLKVDQSVKEFVEWDKDASLKNVGNLYSKSVTVEDIKIPTEPTPKKKFWNSKRFKDFCGFGG